MKKAFVLIAALAGPVAAAPITQRVIKIQAIDDRILATVSAGTDQGVDRTMTCAVFDDDKPAGSCAIIRVDHRTTIVKTELTSAAVEHHGALTVRFTAAR